MEIESTMMDKGSWKKDPSFSEDIMEDGPNKLRRQTGIDNVSSAPRTVIARTQRKNAKKQNPFFSQMHIIVFQFPTWHSYPILITTSQCLMAWEI